MGKSCFSTKLNSSLKVIIVINTYFVKAKKCTDAWVKPVLDIPFDHLLQSEASGKNKRD